MRKPEFLIQEHPVGVRVNPLELLGVLHADDGPVVAVGFSSVSNLREWIGEMQSRSISVECTPAESSDALVAALEREGATLH